jgi:hypothetical protein
MMPKLVTAVAVELIATVDDLLLTFIVSGQEHLKLAEWLPTKRRDGLWQTTCFELFIKAANTDSYFEFNFSPSTEWAAYKFERYREGRGDLSLSVDPFITRGLDDGQYVIEVDVDLSDIPLDLLNIGLSAVIEEMDGTKSYWALAHPPGAPDFHHGDCFAAQLAAPSSS